MSRSYSKIIAVLFTEFLLIFQFAAIAGEKPVMPEKFKSQDFGAHHLIPYKDGVLIKSDDFQTYRVSFTSYSSEETVEVKCDGMDAIFDVGRSPDGFLFLGFGNDEMVLIEESQTGDRKVLQVPDEWQPVADGDLMPEVRARLISSNHRCAAIAKDSLWILDKEWKRYKLPKVPEFYEKFPKKYDSTPFGTVWSLAGNVLHAGWNMGEWGGMLASIDFNASAPEWKYLSGKKDGDHTGIMGNVPIEAIVQSGDGDLWVAEGSPILDGRGVHRRSSDGKWHTLIRGESDEDWKDLKLPGATAIEDLALDSKGRVYFLAGRCGVFELEKNTLRAVFRYDFGMSVQKDDHTVGCHLESLAVGNHGEIFISSNAFGILAFKKMADEWVGKQIMLKPE